MRWTMGRQSDNVEDRRGVGVPLIAGGGIGSLVIVLLALFFGVDPTVLLQSGEQGAPPSVQSPATPQHDELRDFVAVVLADTEDTWRELFRRMNREYRDPKLVLFTHAVPSACGMAGAAVGPFYCPGDQKVYLDLAFFRDLRDRFRAPGDFAQAYVIAHEVGHHVQLLLGISDRVVARRDRADRAEANQLSVRQELQADCFAGVWGYHADRAHHLLEEGDVEEALAAASAIGDDRLQRQAQGRVVPESFTHGTSAQRVRWFQRGFESGEVRRCDTFGTDRL
ncbi:MAG: flagellar biosynthesis protein FlgM [Candidatus Rokuibacteriota bacterium]|nr:MAG: flagellar biosynthesis protein FlgM [Candidatus Rokubacteria bacterium]